MNREEIVSKINELHQYSINISKYNGMLKEIPNREDEIKDWIAQDTEKTKKRKFIFAPVYEQAETATTGFRQGNYQRSF